MRAVVYSDYGGPDVLRHVEIEKPAAADNEILVRVHAASVNPADWHLMRGTPYLIRMGRGFRKPASAQRIGLDYAGTIEAVGRGVTQYSIGDAVFGGREGSLAEYVTVPVDRGAVKKPEKMTFEQAAAVTVAGVTALQALRNKAQVQRGQKVLINGAAGGVGTFAVQLAKVFGAEVTGVQSTRNMELVRSIGANRVIDFVATPNTDDLQILADLMQSATMTPVIDRCYPFMEAAEAMRHLESGHARGKVVVRIAQNA